MTLDEIREACAASSGDDWHFLSSIGDERDGHHTGATFKPDPRITLRWGQVWSENFSEPWHQVFADKTASAHFLDFCFCGQLVDREIYVYADGRYLIPLPKEEGNVPNREDRGYTITRQQFDLFVILNGFGGTFPFADAVERAGIVIRDD